MANSIDINQVKQYNESLKTYKDKAAQVQAEITFISNEVNNICAELSRELNMEVTPENVEQVAKDVADKINSSLQSGNAVLQKIAAEEANVAQQASSVQAVAQEVVQPAPVAPQVAQQAPTAPSAVPGAVPVPPVQNVQTQTAPQGGTVFSNQTQFNGVGDASTLPPLFSI